jgi:hypothetical protein
MGSRSTDLKVVSADSMAARYAKQMCFLWASIRPAPTNSSSDYARHDRLIGVRRPNGPLLFPSPVRPFCAWFAGAIGLESLLQRLKISYTKPFTVSPDSDRMGVRLQGPHLELTERDLDFISEAVTPGTIQTPPGGQPIMLLADCQTIGGYPKLADVITVDLPLAAQLRPGDCVRFKEVRLAEAHRRLLQRDEDLKRFRIGLSLHK